MWVISLWRHCRRYIILNHFQQFSDNFLCKHTRLEPCLCSQSISHAVDQSINFSGATIIVPKYQPMAHQIQCELDPFQAGRSVRSAGEGGSYVIPSSRYHNIQWRDRPNRIESLWYQFSEVFERLVALPFLMPVLRTFNIRPNLLPKDSLQYLVDSIDCAIQLREKDPQAVSKLSQM